MSLDIISDRIKLCDILHQDYGCLIYTNIGGKEYLGTDKYKLAIKKQINHGASSLIFATNKDLVLKLSFYIPMELEILKHTTDAVLQNKTMHVIIGYGQSICPHIKIETDKEKTKTRSQSKSIIKKQTKPSIPHSIHIKDSDINKMKARIMKDYEYYDNNIMLVFLEKFDMSLDELIYKNFDNLTAKEKESIFMQIIICIASFHSLFNMVHDDVSYKNFFIKFIDYNESIQHYMHYKLYGKDIYIPFCGFIVILADYGNVKAPSIDGLISDYNIIYGRYFKDVYNINDDKFKDEKDLLMYLEEIMFSKYYDVNPKHIVNNTTYIIF